MSERLKRRLPLVAAVAAVVALISFIIVDRQVRRFRLDTGETRPIVDAAVAEVQALHPSSLDEPSFRQALEKLRHTPYVGGVWLIHPDGRIAFSNVGFADHGRVQEWATEETQRILSEMPEGFLTPQQRVALLAASALQSEGEHNDVFRQMIRPLRSGDGAELGFVGVSYSVSAAPSGFPGYGYATALFLVPIGLLVYWLMLPWWVFLDAKARGERAWVWTLFVLIGNLAALFAYLLTRHPAVKIPDAD
jgi:hypothetical protein